MKKWLTPLLFLLGFFVFSPPLTWADTPLLDFYYGDGCPHCAEVEPFVEDLSKTYPELEIHTYEVYHNTTHATQLIDAFESHSVPFDERGVPVVFLDEAYFLGADEILEHLEAHIQDILTTSTSESPPALSEVSNPNNAPQKVVEPVSLWAIISLALVDSINPCAIAVLIILLSALITVQEKKRALLGGLAFTAAIYIAYMLFGLGISLSLQIFSGVSYWIFKGVGALAILLGLANLKDFFWYGGGGFFMEIPRSWRPNLKSLLRGVTSPLGAFLMGFVVTLFELPCTGGPYFVALGLLSSYESMYSVFPILLFYNVFFVLPLLLITGFIYFGLATVEKAESWKTRHIRILHLIAGLILTGLGIWVMTN